MVNYYFSIPHGKPCDASIKLLFAVVFSMRNMQQTQQVQSIFSKRKPVIPDLLVPPHIPTNM